MTQGSNKKPAECGESESGTFPAQTVLVPRERYPAISVATLPTRWSADADPLPHLRLGPRIQTPWTPVLFAPACQCTTSRFITPDHVGSPVWPVLIGAWRPGGSYFGTTSGCDDPTRTGWSASTRRALPTNWVPRCSKINETVRWWHQARAWFRARSSRSSARARWMKAIAPLRREVVTEVGGPARGSGPRFR